MESIRKMKVLILVNTLTNVDKFVYANHIAFAVRCYKDFPDAEFIWFTPPRTSIDRARNEAARMALMYECDYLMFIDDDVLIPVDSFKKLKDADKDIIAGLVIIRGMPFNLMVFKDTTPENSKLLQLSYYNDLKIDKDDPVQACDAVGFSCCLIKVDMLKALAPPYFVTGVNNTEDVYFCIKAKNELEPKPSIAVHTGVECGHELFPEFVTYSNRKQLTDYNLAGTAPTEEPTRKYGEEYVRESLNA